MIDTCHDGKSANTTLTIEFMGNRGKVVGSLLILCKLIFSYRKSSPPLRFCIFPWVLQSLREPCL